MSPRRGGKNSWAGGGGTPFDPSLYAVLKEQFYSAREFSPCQTPLIEAPIETGYNTQGISFPYIRFSVTAGSAASIFIFSGDMRVIHPLCAGIELAFPYFGSVDAAPGETADFDIGYVPLESADSINTAITWNMADIQTAPLANAIRIPTAGTVLPLAKPANLIVLQRSLSDSYPGIVYVTGMLSTIWASIVLYP